MEAANDEGEVKRSVVMETERTDNNTDSVSSVEKNVPPISESTERRILDSISQDEQETHETQSEAFFDSDDTLCYIPPFI